MCGRSFLLPRACLLANTQLSTNWVVLCNFTSMYNTSIFTICDMQRRQKSLKLPSTNILTDKLPKISLCFTYIAAAAAGYAVNCCCRRFDLIQTEDVWHRAEHTAAPPWVEIEDFCRRLARNIFCLNDQTNIACFMCFKRCVSSNFLIFCILYTENNQIWGDMIKNWMLHTSSNTWNKQY